MYYLEDICILCLKNSVELQSLFTQDNDGIAFNEKLRCCFPEIFDSTPDAHKLACLECFAKLRFLYESKQSVIYNSTLMRNYLDKLQCEKRTFRQPSIVLSARKRRRKDSNTRHLPEVKVESVGNSFKLKIKNFSLNSTNDEQVKKFDHSYQPTANENGAFLTKYKCLTEEKDLETKNLENVVPFTETRTICVKQEPQFSNLNLNSTNEEQLNIIDHFSKPTAKENGAFLTEYKCRTEERYLETKNVENVPFTETGAICVKQEPQFSNLNLNSTYEDQLNTIGHSYHPTANENVAFLREYNCQTEERNLETKNVEQVPVTDTGNIYVKQEPQFSNCNLNSTNEVQLSTIDHCSQPMANKNVPFSILYNCLTERNVETRNTEKVVPVTDTETINIKEEPQLIDDDSTTSYFDKEAEDSKGCSFRNEDDPNFEISEKEASRPNDYNNQKVTAILNTLKPCYVSNDSVKFCNTCQELLFKDLININVHLYTHIQSSNCSRCEDSLEEINKFQRHMFNHCETMFEILDKGEHGEKFSCALCGQQFDEFSNLKKHIHDKHITSLKCVVCSRVFTHKPNLLRHILVTHCHVKLYKCKLCSTRFTCKEAIKEHVFYQHYNGKVCICKYCNQTFRNPKYLREHITKHHEEDARLEEEKRLTYDSSKNSDTVERLSCAVCHQQLNDVDNLKNHIYDNHVNREDCEICSKIFLRRDAAIRHILETHCRVRLYNCIICAKKFTCKKNYDNHIIQTHNNGNAGAKQVNKVTENLEHFSCGICGTQFDDFEIFKKHIYDEHITGLKCVKCHSSYARRVTLHRHIMEKHCDVNFLKCVICSMQFKNNGSFKNHMIHQHNGGRTITEPDNKAVPIKLVNGEKFTCSICRKQFDVYDRLRRHIYDAHITGLDCIVCSNTYCSRVDLNRHILKMHCNLRFFNCVICSIKFISKESFKNHMSQQHNDGKTITELENKVQPANGEKFTCSICHKQFDVFEGLKRHIYDEHITGVDCVVCSKTYCSRPDLCRHILKIHCDMRLFKCVICSIQFTGKESFKNHMIHHHNDGKTTKEPENKLVPVTVENGEKFTCSICNKQFDVLENIRRHIYDEHITALNCIVCSNTYYSRVDLNRHILEQHCRIKIFKCKLCPLRFACKESFKEHMNQQHPSDRELDNITVTELENNVGPVKKPEEIFIQEEPYYSDEYYTSDEEYEADNYETGKDFSNFAMAEESNSRTSNSSNLIESVGSSVIPTATTTTAASYCEPGAPVDQSDVCDICQKMSLYLSNLSEHLNAHMQESSCSMCKDSAENISRLQRHMLTPCGNTNTPQDSASAADTRTNDKVTCVVCQQEFKFNILRKHLYVHITNLTCVVCNRTFTIKQNLFRHLLHHCELMPLQCEVCGKSFSVKSGLKYHVENAHSSEVIACQYCLTEFKNFRSLQQHILNYHPNYTHTCEVCKRNFPFKNELEKHAKLHTFSQ